MSRVAGKNVLMFGVLSIILLGLLVLVNPVGAEGRELGEDGYYHERIDISEYSGSQLQFKIKNGTFKSFYSVTDSGLTPVSGDLLSVDSYYLGGRTPRPSDMFEIVIDAPDANYELVIHDLKTEANAFDFTDMSITNGNFIKIRTETTKGVKNYYKLYLEQDKEYLYTIYNSDAFRIISPGGEVLKDYPAQGSYR